MVGNLAKAEGHLRALEGLCADPCAEYEDLRNAIANYRQRARK